MLANPQSCRQDADQPKGATTAPGSTHTWPPRHRALPLRKFPALPHAPTTPSSV